jgi:hypothetical protein
LQETRVGAAVELEILAPTLLPLTVQPVIDRTPLFSMPLPLLLSAMVLSVRSAVPWLLTPLPLAGAVLPRKTQPFTVAVPALKKPPPKMFAELPLNVQLWSVTEP